MLSKFSCLCLLLVTQLFFFFLVLEYWGLEIWGMCYLLNIYLWFSVMGPNFNWIVIFHISLHLETFTEPFEKIPLMIFCVYVCMYVTQHLFFKDILNFILNCNFANFFFLFFFFFCLKDDHTKCRIKNRASYNDLIIAC